jgi:hypothetical protein
MSYNYNTVYSTSYYNNQAFAKSSPPKPQNVFWYRGFSDYEIKLLSEKDGQGEACSKKGATGLWAAIEWIDNYYTLGNKKNGWFYPEEEFNWYGWDRFYSDLCDRSVKETPTPTNEQVKPTSEQDVTNQQTQPTSEQAKTNGSA